MPFFDNKFRSNPEIGAVNKKPSKYPPVTPKRIPIPPRSPEKTGKPMAPIRR